ncbi:carbohydrate-binding protein [Neotamlana laminarinivorans]|uniref:carbohydrate-binding protein n=1 Tax=Neotamlana laminarinivorans TaxID=2883124 RepID=UPI00293D9E17|nr:carbohydrate-binding protein [Tamlana laminarinivorans]
MKNYFKPLAMGLLVVFSNCATDELDSELVETNPTSTALSANLNSIIQAEAYSSQSGVQIAGSGSRVGYINNGDWIRFDDFDYSGASSVSIQASSGNSGGIIEFRAGSPTGGDLLGTVSVSNTGGWANMQTFTGSLNDDSTNSDLYVVFTGSSGYLLDIDSFTLSGNSSSSSTNLALEGTAEQSSTGYGGVASRAIDGNTSGVWNQNSVTHSATNEYQSWWQVRLANDTNIEEIVIWNRTNCCMDRLSNFDVFVYNVAGNQVYKTTITETPTPSVTINTGGVFGNRVRVKLKDSQPLSLAEVQVFGESTGEPVDPVDPVDTPTGSNPWDFFENCNQWKITWVDGSEQKQLCSQGEVTGQYEVSDNQDALIFSVYLDGGELGTTSDQTGYSRSELREREEDGSSDVYWTTDGDHALYIQQAITHLPINKSHLVAGQIHGNKSEGIDDSMVVRLEDDHLFLSFNGGDLREDLTIKRGYTLGTKFEVIFRIIDGKHYCYYSEDGNLRTAYNNGNANNYLLSDGGNTVLMDIDYDDVYFKVGNYTQSNESTEEEYFGRSDNYGEVYVYAFNVNHKGESI